MDLDATAAIYINIITWHNYGIFIGEICHTCVWYLGVLARSNLTVKAIHFLETLAIAFTPRSPVMQGRGIYFAC